jgi:opacity protein-like surface antigen
MNKLTIFAAAAAALGMAGLAAPASAQDMGNNWYANLGYTHFDTDRGDLGGVTGRLGYHFTPNLGAEAEYSAGTNSGDFGKLDDAWGLYGVGTIPVTSNLGVFGRVGYQQIHIDGRNGATDSDGEGLGYGAGVQWNATPTLGVRGEYTRLSDADADTWSVAGVLNF